MCRETLIPLLVFAAAALGPSQDVHAQFPRSVHHALSIALYPSEGQLSGVDRITVDARNASSLVFLLSQSASVGSVRVSGKNQAFVLQEGRLRIPLETRDFIASLPVEIEYSASFRDPVPDTFANTDNPGYGVTGIISERGTFLQAGAGWYPEIPGSRPTFRLRVEAPAGTLAVTSGRSLVHETKDGRSYSEWEAGFPSEGLSLSAGPYTVQRKEAGGLTVATYFYPQSASLSREYLDASLRVLALYEGLIGPYPFQQFSIVENFFPTGYGFPSYTLLGSTVLRLPFILETSLGHEIAHCWWGNGVWVDVREGNWCEGLTTYLADYLFKERISEEEGRLYRLQILRNFTTLVNPGNDFPLSQFKGRVDPSSQAIGYGKAAMVFHMMRRRLGDRIFWDGLKQVYRTKLFEEASWRDFQVAFEGRAGASLEPFFEQWILRKGAPHLRLQSPELRKEGTSWSVAGSLAQKDPSYDLEVPVGLWSASARKDITLPVRETVAAFQISLDERPSRLVVDPGSHVMRVLDPAEIPPSVNSLKASPSVLLVLPEEGSSQGREIARILVQSLGLKKFRILPKDALKATDSKDSDLLLLGFAGNDPLPFRTPEGLVIGNHGFKVDGKEYDKPSDSFFGVFRSSAQEQRLVAVFQPPSERHAGDVAGKITHYGRYSYLVFREGANIVKGTWPVGESPLVHEWEKE